MKTPKANKQKAKATSGSVGGTLPKIWLGKWWKPWTWRKYGTLTTHQWK